MTTSSQPDSNHDNFDYLYWNYYPFLHVGHSYSNRGLNFIDGFLCNRIHHPFLLSDNRHYTFYIWRRIFRFHPIVPYLFAPGYLACAWAWFLRIGTFLGCYTLLNPTVHTWQNVRNRPNHPPITPTTSSHHPNAATDTSPRAPLFPHPLCSPTSPSDRRTPMGSPNWSGVVCADQWGNYVCVLILRKGGCGQVYVVGV